MNLLNELLMLRESVGKNLLGLTINDKKITEKTKDEKWTGDFICSSNKLTSLEYCPSEVGGDFSCFNNKLTSLEHCPSEVGEDFLCSSNKLKDLHNIHKQLKKMNGGFYVDKNPIESSVLGLLLIPGCKEVILDNEQVEEILNRYLPNTRGQRAVVECQSELIDADLEDFAHL